MFKTLGGDRLGSGKKMKVELHNYERSTHDIGYVWRSTASAGTLIPFLDELALPGTTFDIALGCDVLTHPTIGPLLGSYKAQLDVFLIPIRLYNSKLHNNALGIGRNMSQIKLPQIELTSKTGIIYEDLEDLDNSQINPSSLPAYLGIRGVGRNASLADVKRQFNACSILGYWDTVKNYYASKQEEIAAVIHTDNEALANFVTGVTHYPGALGIPQLPATPTMQLLTNVSSFVIGFSAPIKTYQIIMQTSRGDIPLSDLMTGETIIGSNVQGTYNFTRWGTMELYSWRYINNTDLRNGTPRVVTFPLVNLDTMRENILAADGSTTFVIDDTTLPPYGWLAEENTLLHSQEGLAIKTYQSDLFNNWLKTENIEAISAATAIDTSGGSFTFDTFLISKKVWNMLQRINVSGGSYDDWMDAVYVNERYKSAETPMYMGGLIKEVIFNEVVSNTATEEQPLGTLAGRGGMAAKHKGGTMVIHIDEPSIVLGLFSLTPRIDYSQGNKWHTALKTVDDFHKPALDGIGFQDLLTNQLAWWSDVWNGATWTTPSAGKQPAWINYMTNVNKTYGNFAIQDNQMFMTLNRRYESDAGQIKDLTSYIDPAKFNFIFAETALDAQNFWVQIGVDIKARRKMSGKLMPTL